MTVATKRIELYWLVVASLMGLVLATRPVFSIYTIFVVAIVSISLLSPLSALGLMLISSPLRALIATEASFNLPIDVGQASFILFCIAYCLNLVKQNRLPRWPTNLIYVTLAIFIIATGFTIFQASSIGFWLSEWLKWVIVLITTLFVVDIARGGNWTIILYLLILSGSTHAIVGIYIFFGGSGADHLLINNTYFRAFGTFGQPNPFGGFMGIMLPIALSLLLTRLNFLYSSIKQISQSRIRLMLINLPFILCLIVAISLLFLGLIMSWSRGAWLSAVVSISVMALLIPRSTWVRVFIIAGCVILPITLSYFNLIPKSIVTRISSSTSEFFAIDDVRGVDITTDNYAVVERLAHWQAAVNMATVNPWLGVGFGNYPVVYDEYRLINWSEPLGHAHNYYLNILAEGGIITALTYLLVFFSIIWTALRTLRYAGFTYRLLTIGLLASVIYILSHSFLDNLYVNNIFLHLGALLGVLIVLSEDVWSYKLWE